MATTRYAWIKISPAVCGFGEWFCSKPSRAEDETYEDEADLVSARKDCDGQLYELGVDELPVWDGDPDTDKVRDIRGHIHVEPSRVFARVEHGRVSYEGIVRV